MKKKTLHILIAFILMCLAFNLRSQIKSIGIPSIVNYSRKEYHASTQNWAAIQDKRGILYFANNDGLLEFDGINWRLIQMPNKSVVHSIATDKDGTIYVGAYDEFGYLEPDQNGKLQYFSLKDLVPGELKNFREIWKIHVTDEGIVFQSFSEIFLYQNNQIKVIAQKRDFHFSFYVKDELYITERNKGLLKLKDEKLIPVKGGEVFNNDVWMMLPLSDSRIVIGTTNRGLFVLDDNRVSKWDIPVNEFLIQNQIYSATLVKGYIALGTILNGLVVIDSEGNPVQHINREKGLQNNTVLSVYADNYDNLWLGLDNGIDYVIINSPFTNIANESQIGAGYTSIIFDNKLYLGTNQGLFYKEWIEPFDPLNDVSEFKMVKNTQGQVWDLFEHNNNLFCGHNNGTYIIKDDKAELISEMLGGWLLFNVPDKENMILQGTYTGLVKYETNNNLDWNVSKIQGFNESSREIEMYLGKDDYTLWISHGYKGIFKLTLNKDLDQVKEIDFYNESNGLLTNIGNHVLRFNDKIIVTNNTGIYNYNDAKRSFVPDSELMDLFENNGSIREMIKDRSGNIWFVQGEEMGMVKKLSDGNYKLNRTIFKSFAGNFVGGFEDIYPYDDKGVILATQDGFAHYQTSFLKDVDIPFNALIRCIKADNDSILFGGTVSKTNGLDETNQVNTDVLDLSYKLHNLKFEFSATHYENINNIEYQYYLEGLDESWLEWTKETTKEYTNLKEGTYTFHLKARNIFNIESDITSYRFVINPPWYRSTIAFIAYLIVLGFIIWLVFKQIRKRLEREKKALQLKQKKELHQQKINHENEVLSVQQEIVKLRNEKLRIENDKNRAEVELKTKELASYAMQVTQKNETLYTMKEQLIQISQKVNPDAQKHLNRLIRKIEQSTNQKEDWEKFEGYFDQVYEDFTKRLREQFPHLTPNDIKLCAYLRMNLSTKEISPLLNISVRGVEVSRYRLRKKLNLPKTENLIDFMMNL